MKTAVMEQPVRQRSLSVSLRWLVQLAKESSTALFISTLMRNGSEWISHTLWTST